MTTTQARRGRVIALRVVAATLALIILVAVNVTMILPWIAWLPEQRLLSMGMSTEDVPEWLVQGTAIQLNITIMLVCAVLQLRRPANNVAALWLIITFMGSQLVYDTVRLDFGSPIWYVVYALFLAIVGLHPRRFAPLRPVDPIAATVAAIGAVGLIWFAVGELRQQLAPADPPDNFHFGMVLAAAVTLVAAVLAATAVPGRWIGVAVATAMAVLVGISSLAHPSAPSALSTPWAWVAIVWGLGVLVVNRRHMFARPPEPTPVQGRVEVGQDA